MSRSLSPARGPVTKPRFVPKPSNLRRRDDAGGFVLPGYEKGVPKDAPVATH